MKSIFAIGLIIFAVTFCGIGDRLKQLQGDSSSGTNSSSGPSKTSSSDADVEKPVLTSEQQAIADGGTEVVTPAPGTRPAGVETPGRLEKDAGNEGVIQLRLARQRVSYRHDLGHVGQLPIRGQPRGYI